MLDNQLNDQITVTGSRIKYKSCRKVESFSIYRGNMGIVVGCTFAVYKLFFREITCATYLFC